MKERLLFKTEMPEIEEGEAKLTYKEIVEDLAIAEKIFVEYQANLAQIASFSENMSDLVKEGSQSYHEICNEILSKIDRVMDLIKDLEEQKTLLEGKKYEVN